ncbi:MAG: hypothetical protein RL177_1440 [Bacteroidota bacterium]
MKPSFAVLILVFIFISTPAFSQIQTIDTQDKTSGWLTTFNAEFGGDPVTTVLFVDGSTQDVNAGQGISLSIGRFIRPNSGLFMYSAGLGFKYVTTKADNADITLTRFVLDARVDRGLPNNLWVGVGPVAHFGTKLKTDGLGPNESYDPALGLNVRLGWKALSVTYTKMSYKGEMGGTYDASGIGFSGHWPF